MTSEKRKIKLWEPSFEPWQPQKEPSKQIAVLMSGGVDSSITAYLLAEQGWDVLGITMKIPVSCNTSARGCCGADAGYVCGQLNIPHYFVDVTESFNELIVKRFRESYARGETPNPCIDCNTLLKFSLLWDFLEEKFGISYLATGHYARITRIAERAYLGQAKDKTKDQSYFLYGIAAERLVRLVLPLGEFTKEEVRALARQISLGVAEKAESMELCFAGQGDYRAALDIVVAQTGDIMDMHGNKIGTHRGVANYTLGQRRGIGFAGGKPLYVGRINASANTIALGTRDEVSFKTIRANDINALIPTALITGNCLYGKIRSYGEPRLCRLIDVGQTNMTVEFDEPQFAPCPGQRLVLYNEDDNIIAGGTIF
jgi:tRNA-specific 2-thiouridylase